MTDHKRILEKAIKKANKNGFGVNDGWIIPSADKLLFDDEYKKLIFNHNFARALWGDELNLGQNEHRRNNITNYPLSYPLYEWQWKLSQMVIAEDPIKYLGENI